MLYCHKCGEPNNDNAYKCIGCGEVLHHTDRPDRPAAMPIYASAVSSHLVWAILATIFCCLPFGVVAIVYAAQVSGRLAAGDYAGAVNSSENAKKWCWISFAVGIVPSLLITISIIADIAAYTPD